MLTPKNMQDLYDRLRDAAPEIAQTVLRKVYTRYLEDPLGQAKVGIDFSVWTSWHLSNVMGAPEMPTDKVITEGDYLAKTLAFWDKTDISKGIIHSIPNPREIDGIWLRVGLMAAQRDGYVTVTGPDRSIRFTKAAFQMYHDQMHQQQIVKYEGQKTHQR